MEWGSCTATDDYEVEGWECATVEVPLSYDGPTRRSITIALTRLPATDHATRIGSLLVNPGGPGGSGIEAVHFLVDELPGTEVGSTSSASTRGATALHAGRLRGGRRQGRRGRSGPDAGTPAEITALVDRLAAPRRAAPTPRVTCSLTWGR